MIASDTFQIEGTRAELARVLRCNESELHAALIDLKASEAAVVTLHSNGRVTLLSRRRLKEQKARENGRSRVSKHREKHPCNADPPSISDSVSESEKVGGGGGRIRFVKPDMAEMEFHAMKIGLVATEITNFFNFYESKGWRVGNTPMRSWQAAMARWKVNYEAGTYANRGSINKPNPRNAGIATNASEQGRTLAAVAAARSQKPVPKPVATEVAELGLSPSKDSEPC